MRLGRRMSATTIAQTTMTVADQQQETRDSDRNGGLDTGLPANSSSSDPGCSISHSMP